MPWPFTIPEFLKKRACRYLLQHYLGQYLEEKIQLEDLTVDLYNGTGTITNVPLNVEAINESLEETGAPVQVVSGYLGQVSISVPWSALMSNSCRVEITGLTLSVMPCISSSPGEDFATMTDSLFCSSMSNSLQMAEEVLRSGPVSGEGGGGGGEGEGEGEGRATFEGMEALARAIETVLSRVQIDLRDTVVQIVHHSLDYTHQYFIRIRIQSIKFYDELKGGGGDESSVDRPDGNEGGDNGRQTAVDTKILELSRITLEVGAVGEDIHTSTLSPEELPGVPVACVSGDVSVSVKLRGVEVAPVPRVQVEAVVGGVHCLLAPTQVHILTEMATNLRSGRGRSVGQVGTGINRPIPSKEMHGIESQLRHHFHEERRRREHSGDLLRADPYQNPLLQGNGRRGGSGMTDSTCMASPDMFFSLNLHDSFSEVSRSDLGGDRSMESSLYSATTSSTMGDSYTSAVHNRGKPPGSVYSRYTERSGVGSGLDNIPLGGGCGLQQLVGRGHGVSRQSKNRDDSNSRMGGARGGVSQQDVCKYSLTVSGVTVAVLQADPAYTHPSNQTQTQHGGHTELSATGPSSDGTSSNGAPSSGTSPNEPSSNGTSGPFSSLDSSGLDPMYYLTEVTEVMRGGVNRREIQRQQERLGQALPLDHLFVWFSTVRTAVNLQGGNTNLQLTIASCEMWEFLYSNTANLPHITTPVSAAPLVELLEDISLSQPCIRLKVASTTDTSRKRHKQSSPDQLISVDLSLTSPHFNIDPTLAERVQPLLHPSSSSPSLTGQRGGAGSRLPGSQLKHSLYMTTSNVHSIAQQRQAVFNQAVGSDPQSSADQKIHFKMTTSSISLSLRFPVPELSEKHSRLPWYHPSLRREVLHVVLSGITLTSTLHPHPPHTTTAAVYDTQFARADAYLSSDGSVEGRELFLTVSCSTDAEQSSLYGATDGGTANVQLVVQSVDDNTLEQLNRFSPPSSHPHTHTPPHPLMWDDMGLGMEGGGRGLATGPTPFSTKKDMYSGKGGTQEDGPQEHTEHLVTPGSRQEMEEFEQHTSSQSQYYINCHLPSMRLHLPSKRFLDTLYSRFATDLALWRPASPEQVERANAAKSLFFSSVDIQPAATAEEKVQMFQSVLREHSEDAELGEDALTAEEFLPSPPSPSRPPSPAGLSRLAVALSVDSAQVSMLLHVEEETEESGGVRVNPSSCGPNNSPGDSLYASALSQPPLLDIESEGGEEGEGGRGGVREGETGRRGDRGLAVVDLSTLHFYIVSGYRGNRNHDYVCAYVDQFSLSHTGSLCASGLSPFSAMRDSPHHPSLPHLHHIIQHSPERLQMKPTTRGESRPPPMVSVAMDIRMEPERNSKTNKCAVALEDTLINHHITPLSHNCFKQLGEFLSLTEETVEGYEPPSLITEMHLHLQDLRLEYCPLHLPLTALLTVSSIQLSTSLVAGSPLLVVRILVDHTHLALSDSTHHSPTLREDYVCVLDLDWFELTLRMCNTTQFEEESQKLFSHLPDTSVECSSNVLQIHTCVDSCTALRDLLVYLASDGDLRPQPSEASLGSYSSLAIRGSPHDSLGSHAASDVTNPTSATPLLPSSHTPSSPPSLDIGDLISDAMDESSPATPTPPSLHQATPTQTRLSRSGGAVSGGGYQRSSVVGGAPSDVSVSDAESAGATHKNRMQVVECGEKSLDIDFGDSDEEEEEKREVWRVTATTTGGSGAGGTVMLTTSREGVGGGVSRMGVAGRRSNVEGVGDESDEEGFCVLDAPTSTYVAPGSKPVVKCLLDEGETWRIVDNHFAIPERNVDQLQRPKHFPEPVLQYTLKELTIVWHIYGGHDFTSTSSSPHSHTPPSGTSPQTYNSTSHCPPSSGSRARATPTGPRPLRSRPTMSPGGSTPSYSPSPGSRPSGVPASGGRGVRMKRPSSGGRGGWSVAGGAGRDHSVLMEVEVDKLRLQYETFPQDSVQASRLAFLVRDLELRDRLAQSNINKFLYQYSTESMPRQSNANMVTLKVLNTRPELETHSEEEEMSIRLSLLPIRLNIDQDSFYFLFEFFSQVSDTSSINSSAAPPTLPPSTMKPHRQSPTGPSSSDNKQVFIRSFVFQPSLPIKIDYTTKWRFPTDTMGTLPGILISLYHLDNSELTLKSLNCKTGFLGWESLVECVTHEWSTDIMSRQLPLILKGVGPTHYITQFVHGVVDLVRLPYHQYQEDGRLVWGLQQGASSFSTSTGVAVVELTSRTLETLQSVAQMVYDLVTPVPVEGRSNQGLAHRRKAPHQPQDFREGVSNAYDVMTAGLTGTAVDLYAVASQEHEERGVTGAVGGILRQIPGTVVKPVILLSEATRHVLGGVKNQFVPDARREAKEKWKTIETSD